jgi:hypothetical protein
MSDLENDQALIHLRVERERKARWVALSRKSGMKLTDWIVAAIEGNIRENFHDEPCLATNRPPSNP